MRVKHGTKVKFTLKCGRRILERRIIDVKVLPGTVTLTSMMYNACIDGGVLWRHPGTGELLSKTPTWSIALVDPSDELTGDAQCDCDSCVNTQT